MYLQEYDQQDLDGLFQLIGKGVKGVVKVGKKIFKGGKQVGALQQQVNTGTGGVALTPQEFAISQGVAPPTRALPTTYGTSGMPPWVIPAAIGSIGLVAVLALSRKK